jgi:PKD repeat protein
MTISLRYCSPRISLALGLMAVLSSGCTLQEQPTPDLSGPSELGLSLSVVAQPEILPRDGSSMSLIVIAAFDSNGKPKSDQRLILTANAGTLTPTEVRTGSDGRATATYTAPGLNERVSTATIAALPVGVLGGDSANVNPRTVRIAVLGPSIPFASFSFSPTTAAVLDTVTFDANNTFLDGAACGSACSYSWDFDDGSSTETGIVRQHTFTRSGVFNVSLTVTSLAFGTSNSSTRPVVIAPPAPPIANFTTGPCAVVVVRCFRFTDASTVGAGATITGYLIDFGDNSNATSMPAERTYAVAGTYTIRYTVTDSLNRTATVTRPLVVP